MVMFYFSALSDLSYILVGNNYCENVNKWLYKYNRINTIHTITTK
jgi:hypothetical protein